MRRGWAGPLVPVYWVGVAGKNWLYDRGVLGVRRLGWPVVSVGSLSAGGAGKTPVVLALAELLGRQGVGVDVLSRGYGRGSAGVEEVDAAGSAGRFGDEPLELARAGVRVFVGAERFEAGLAAEKKNAKCAKAEPRRSRRVHLLDDGFQHRRLGRDLDLVLLTAEDVGDSLLPGGNLREPLGALRRAGVIVVREEEVAGLREVLERFRKEVWVIRREMVLPEGGVEGLLAFCGIARPEGFFGMLAGVKGTVAFGDHHVYGGADVERLVREAERVGARGFVTTAKDDVKITKEMRERLGSVVVAGLRVKFVDESAVLRRFEGLLR